MKTWEMIKSLTENDNLRFKAQDGMTSEVAVNGCLVLKDSDGDEAEVRIVGGLTEMDPDEWKLMPQEITWQEAIQAWVEGKDIRVVQGCEENTIRQSWRNRFGIVLGDMNGFDCSYFTKGKWYIE